MKKILMFLMIIFSTISFSNYEEIVSKFNKLEKDFIELINLESLEHNKAINKFNEIENQINNKLNFKKEIENRINNLQSANVIKYFKDEYVMILKEYKGLLVNLDEEVKELKKVQEEYKKVIDLKKGGK